MQEINNEFTGDADQDALDAEVEAEIAKALGDKSIDELMQDATEPASAPPGSASGSDDASQGGAGDSQVQLALKRGRISAIQGADVFVELSGLDAKHQGVVPLDQFERPPRLGSIMDFVVERIDEAEGIIVLSREGAVGRTTWDHVRKGSVVEARVTGTNKGGLELEMVGRIRAFMPASQIDLHHVDDLEALVGEKLVALVVELDRRGRKVLLSRRRHLEQERESMRRKIWKQIEVGQVLEGKVSSLAPYGAFVDLGGVDGLVHVSDISYTRIEDPNEELKVGQPVKVKVLKLDAEQHRISLGMKQVQPDPWEKFAERVQTGSALTGRVVRVMDFGAFVEVEAGIEGLLPIAEMGWSRVRRAEDVAKVGETLHLAVIQVDAQRRRLSLSLKQATDDPWLGAEHKYARGSEVPGRVLSTTDFGAFVELESGVEGMVHISELSLQRVNRVEDVVEVGLTYAFRVLEADEEQRRIGLTLKPAAQAHEDAQARSGQASAGGSQAHRRPPPNLKGGLE
jgi:small subunit ribosomal protein S1